MVSYSSTTTQPNIEVPMNNHFVTSQYIEELKFVDKEIKEEFEGKNYITGMPTQMQLVKTMKELTEMIKSLILKDIK